MKQLRPVTLFITIASLIVGAVMAAVVFNKRALSFGRTDSAKEANVVSPAVLAPQAFVPDGLPVVLSDINAITLSQDNDKQAFVSALQFQLVASGRDQLTSLNLMVFEFDSEGKLRRVNAWVRPVDLSSGKTEEITLPIERRLPNGNRLLLGVERANGPSSRWETDFADLAKGMAAAAGHQRLVNIAARQEQPAQDDSGALLCSEGFRRALALAQAGDKTGITSYTCNQHDRSYQFTFNGKVLTQ
jgi:hypothetical protein